MTEKTSFIDCYLSKYKEYYEIMVKYVGDIFSKIHSQGFFIEYPDHGIVHSKKIIENIDRLLLLKTDDLNELESMILLFSIFYHDFGMVVDAKDVNDFVQDSYKMNSNYQFENFSKFINDDKLIRPNADSDVSLMENYIRKNHHLISANKIFHAWQNLSICSNDKHCDNCKHIVADLSASHGWDNEEIDKLRTCVPIECPLLKDTKNINVQFLSILLRLGDLLDFTNGRVPTYLYDFINPNNLKSINEWKKQLAVIGINFDATDPEMLNVYGYVNDIDIYFCIMDFLDYVSQNLDESRKVLKNNEKKIKPKKINGDAIKTDGFEKTKLRFESDYESILSLLTKELYKGETKLNVVISEFLQNSIDACRFRSYHDLDYKPQINIEYDAKNRTLSIVDNGKGMDMDEISNCLLRIGKSFYKSHAINGFTPYSQFGIGFLSCYLIASSITVKTRKYDKSHDHESIHLSIRSIEDYVTKLKHSETFEPGTNITLKLKEELSESITEIATARVDRIDIPIKIKEKDNTSTIGIKKFPYERNAKIKDNLSITHNYLDPSSHKPLELVETFSLKEIRINTNDVKGHLYYYINSSNFMTDLFQIGSRSNLSLSDIQETRSISMNGKKIFCNPDYYSKWFRLNPMSSFFLHDLNLIDFPLMVSLDRRYCQPEQSEKLHNVQKAIDDKIIKEIKKVLKNIDDNSRFLFTKNLLDIIQFNKKIDESEDKNFIRLMDDLHVIRFVEQIQELKILKTKKEFLYICTTGSNSYPNFFSNGIFEPVIIFKKILDLYKKKRSSPQVEFCDFLFFDKIEPYLFSYFHPEQVVIDLVKEYSGLKFAKNKPKLSPDLMKIDNGFVLPFFVNGNLDKSLLATLVGKYVLFNLNHPLLCYCIENEIPKDEIEKLFQRLIRDYTAQICLLNDARFEYFKKDVSKFCEEFSLPPDMFQINQKTFVDWDYAEYWEALVKQNKRKSKKA